MVATVNDRDSAEFENRNTEDGHSDDEDVIAKEVKFAVNDLVPNEFSNLIKGSIEKILCKLL